MTRQESMLKAIEDHCLRNHIKFYQDGAVWRFRSYTVDISTCDLNFVNLKDLKPVKPRYNKDD